MSVVVKSAAFAALVARLQRLRFITEIAAYRSPRVLIVLNRADAVRGQFRGALLQQSVKRMLGIFSHSARGLL